MRTVPLLSSVPACGSALVLQLTSTELGTSVLRWKCWKYQGRIRVRASSALSVSRLDLSASNCSWRSAMRAASSAAAPFSSGKTGYLLLVSSFFLAMPPRFLFFNPLAGVGAWAVGVVVGSATAIAGPRGSCLLVVINQ